MADERLHFTDRMSSYNAMYAAEHVVRYYCVSGLCRGKRVLDVACGEGYGSSLLAMWGAAEVVGVDVSAEAIDAARQVFAKPNIKFLQGDACRLNDVLGDVREFDLIVSFETMEHVEDVPALLSGILRYLAKGGAIVITCPNDHVESAGNPYHMRAYTFSEFREATTAILGPASCWLLGTPAHGQLLYPAGDSLMENASDNHMILLTRCNKLSQAAVIPGQHNIAPSAAACKFYMGCWGQTIEASAVISPQSFPAFAEPWRALEYFKQERDELAVRGKELAASAEVLRQERDEMAARAQELAASAEVLRQERDEMAARGQKLAASTEVLRIAKANVDGQLADLRRRVLMHARMQAASAEALRVAQNDLAGAQVELERWRAFHQSRAYRAMQLYARSYRLPVIGPILQRLRHTTGAMVRAIRRR